MGDGPPVIILVLLIVLAALWAIVLLPPLLERRKGSPSNSIVAFNQRLNTLATTRRGTAALTRQVSSSTPPRSTVTTIDANGNRVGEVEHPLYRRAIGARPSEIPINATVTPPPLPEPPPFETVPPPRNESEAAVIKRRRQVFEGLAGVAGATFVVGLLPGMRGVLLLSFIFIALLAGYVWMLLQWKRQRIERAAKVRPLRKPEGPLVTEDGLPGPSHPSFEESIDLDHPALTGTDGRGPRVEGVRIIR